MCIYIHTYNQLFLINNLVCIFMLFRVSQVKCVYISFFRVIRGVTTETVLILQWSITPLTLLSKLWALKWFSGYKHWLFCSVSRFHGCLEYPHLRFGCPDYELHLSDHSIHLASVFGRIQHFHFLCCQCATALVLNRCRSRLLLTAQPTLVPHR